MKPVQNVERMPRFFRYHLEVGLPHIAANITQLLRSLLAKPAEESQQGFGFAARSNPKQPFTISIDLVDQCQVLMPPLPLDLIDTNGFDAR